MILSAFLANLLHKINKHVLNRAKTFHISFVETSVYTVQAIVSSKGFNIPNSCINL
jgi:hypothetical protein